MDDQLILKNRLKVARAEKGLSQTQLAEMVGVSRNTISSIETGQFNPTAKLALVLCIAGEKILGDLFYFDGKRARSPGGEPSSLLSRRCGCPVGFPGCRREQFGRRSS